MTDSLPADALPLARFPLFEGADPAALARAEARATWRDFATGETVLDFDCPSSEVRFVARGGPLRVLMRATGGREKIVAETGPGGFVGELAAIAGPAAAPSAGIRAVHRARLCILPGDAFLGVVLASPPVAHRLLATLAERVRSQNRRLLEYAALPTRHRLCAELLRLARTRPAALGGGLAISPPPGRPDLAARIGARPGQGGRYRSGPLWQPLRAAMSDLHRERMEETAMWFRKTRVLALGAMLGLAACAPGTSGSLVVGAAPAWHGGSAWGAPGWHGHARPWRHDPFWHGRPVSQWGGGPWAGHRHHHAWRHHPHGWHRPGWHGGPRHFRW